MPPLETKRPTVHPTKQPNDERPTLEPQEQVNDAITAWVALFNHLYAWIEATFRTEGRQLRWEFGGREKKSEREGKPG